MRLDTYRCRRDFRRTPEPSGAPRPPSRGRSFVIQRNRNGKQNWLLIKEQDGTAAQAAPKPKPSDALTEKQPRTLQHVTEARKKALPPFVDPQLATLVDRMPAGEGWLHEIKLDGYRILARIEGGRARLLTRNGKDWTARVGTLATGLSRLPVDRALLDGEVVVLDERGVSKFQALQEPSLRTRRVAPRGTTRSTSPRGGRKGKILIDYLRNSQGATAVAAYSTRARAGAPVSTPVGWNELSAALRSDRYTVENLPRRLAALKKDPWEGYLRLRQTIPDRTKTTRALGDE